MSSQVCSACGKTVSDSALQNGSAVVHGGRVYCTQCASLIVTPGTLPAVKNEELEVLQEYKISFTAPDVPSPFAAKPSGGVSVPVSNVGRELPPGAAPVVEGEDADMPINPDDDEWFKPKGNSGGTAVKEASNPRIPAAPAPTLPKPALIPPRPAAKASGVSSRVVAPAKKSESTSARLAAAPALEMPVADAPAAKAPVRPASVRTSAAGPIDGEASPANKNKSSRRMMPAAKAAPVPPPQIQQPEPEIEAEAPAEEQDHDVVAPGSARLRKSSRRSSASRGSARSSASRSAREDRDEKENKKDKRKGGKEKDNTPIYIGAGVALLLLVGAFVMAKGGDKDEAVKKGPVEEALDKTPSGDYARQADQALRSGNVSAARDFYTRAATQAEREGNGTQARNYSMKAMDVIKSSKLHDR